MIVAMDSLGDLKWMKFTNCAKITRRKQNERYHNSKC